MSEILSGLFSSDFLWRLAGAVIELLIGFFLGPLARRWIIRMKPKGVDQGVLTFTGSFVNIFIRFLAIVIAMGQIGVNMDVVVGAFSAVGLGVSLALKENMANVAGGMQILITRPFSVGDYIAIDGSEGTCKEIELMFTTLETVNGQEVIIPNSTLVNDVITNYSRFPKRRIVIKVAASNMGDYESFRTQIQAVMESTPEILKNPAPKTVVSGFTDTGNGMYINLVCYCNNEDYWDLLYSLNEKTQQIRKECGLLQPEENVVVRQS